MPALKRVSLEYDNIGRVLFQANKRSKRISIRVNPEKGVRVAFPPSTSLKRAKKYFEDNLDWVEKNVVKTRQRQLHRDNFYGDLPPLDVEKEAERLYLRLVELAEYHGYFFNKVTFRHQKTRWGSCSAKNNISLNINLARLPQELCDYVLLHELAHTRVKNHSKQFWAELDIITDYRAKELRKRMSKYPIPKPQ